MEIKGEVFRIGEKLKGMVLFVFITWCSSVVRDVELSDGWSEDFSFLFFDMSFDSSGRTVIITFR